MNMRQLSLVVGLAGILFSGAAHAATSNPVIGTDPFTQNTCAASAATNHSANVEPDSFAYGTTIVAAYQVGRIYDGGACAIGFSVSMDSGVTWQSGLLPGLTKYSGGTYDRVTDASVAYDAAHGVWLISSLVLTEAGGIKGKAVLTSRSTDGLHWDGPVTTNSTSLDPDKNWIVCDNVSVSYKGHCYTEWDDYGAGNKLYMSTSTDGGQSWGPDTTNNAGVIGGQPVVRPDGVVIVPTANANETAIGAFRSADGGATWSAVTTITTIRHHTVAGNLREGPLPSAEIDGGGTVYVAWADCRFRRSCKTNDIVFVKSSDATGKTWSAVTRVPIDSTSSGLDHFIPGLAVNAADATGRIGLTYYYYNAGSTSLNVGFISSQNGGSSWSSPVAVTTLSEAFPVSWVANTSQGRMVGDYISTSFTADGQAHGIFMQSSAPGTGSTTSCTTTALDNCNEFAVSFPTVTAAPRVAAAKDPVLFSGAGGAGAQSFWNIVANKGRKHRN